VILAGCNHSEPFAGQRYSPDGPFTTALPRQLTYSFGKDQNPAWLADESGFIYSAEVTDNPIHDFCLDRLPAEGGVITASYCVTDASQDDSLNALREPATGPGGRLSYLSETSRAGSLTEEHMELRVGALDSPLAATVLESFPYPAPDGRTHTRGSHFGWLDQNSLVYVGETSSYPVVGRGPARDTLAIGLNVVRLRLDGTRDLVPGTDLATSVYPMADGTGIYFTVWGDSRVFRQDLATATTATAFDFGGAGVARDVQVRGERLVAVVGGDVTDSIDATLGPIQLDGGGVIHVVDLTSGSDAALDAGGRLFLRPALSPSGRRIVAETFVGRSKDLWLFELP